MKKPYSGQKTNVQKNTESESDKDNGPTTRSKEKMKQVSDLPYKSVGSLKPVEEQPPVPVRYARELKQPAYKHTTEIEDGVELANILERILAGDVSLTHKELLAISPKLREAYKDRIAKKRVAIKSANTIAISETELTDIHEEGEKLIQVATLAVPEKSVETLLDIEGRPYLTWRITDSILQYLETVPTEEWAKQVFSIAKPEKIAGTDIASLRVIPALVNDVREEEALLDSGSQIIAMSRAAAMECKIVWDPDVTINMQSANGQISRTCGLAKNVPLSFGEVTVFLQIHVVENAPYRILLGRPFDILTESRIVNSAEGMQMIVVTDPNTKHRMTLPTYEKGELPSVREGNF